MNAVNGTAEGATRPVAGVTTLTERRGRFTELRGKPAVVATYNYADEDGELIFRVERLEPKSFRQSRPDGRGGWVYNLEGVRRVPYRARELVHSVANGLTVVIVEGEKDADRVADLGLSATTFAGGASGWREDYGEWFIDANVVVIPDKDPPGAKYAAMIAQSLVGLARSVRILELPKLPPKGDVSDWLDAGGRAAELESLIAESPAWEPIDSLPPTVTNGNGTRVGLGSFPDLARSGAIETVDLAGDHLNAARFLAEHKGEVIYSPEQNLWFVWSGGWWQEDRLDLVHKRANATIDSLRTWAAEAPNAEEFKRRAKHYADSTRSGRRDGMLSIAGPEVAVAVDQLDRHPHLLACRNGTVNLRSGERGPADPGHLITRGVDLEYDPSAHSPEWERFLERILAEDPDLIAYVQRLLGYAITGEVGEHLLPNFYGDGENGKSQLLIAVQDILGAAEPQQRRIERGDARSGSIPRLLRDFTAHIALCACLRHLLQQYARRALAIGAQGDACRQLFGRGEVVLYTLSQIQTLQSNDALVARGALIGLDRDAQATVADQLAKRRLPADRRSGAGERADRKIMGALRHQQRHQAVAGQLQSQGAMKFESRRQQYACGHGLAQQRLDARRIALVTAQLAPGLVEPNPEAAHRMVLENEPPQLAGATAAPLSHRASS